MYTRVVPFLWIAFSCYCCYVMLFKSTRVGHFCLHEVVGIVNTKRFDACDLRPWKKNGKWFIGTKTALRALGFRVLGSSYSRDSFQHGIFRNHCASLSRLESRRSSPTLYELSRVFIVNEIVENVSSLLLASLWLFALHVESNIGGHCWWWCCVGLPSWRGFLWRLGCIWWWVSLFMAFRS